MEMTNNKQNRERIGFLDLNMEHPDFSLGAEIACCLNGGDVLIHDLEADFGVGSTEIRTALDQFCKRTDLRVAYVNGGPGDRGRRVSVRNDSGRTWQLHADAYWRLVGNGPNGD